MFLRHPRTCLLCFLDNPYILSIHFIYLYNYNFGHLLVVTAEAETPTEVDDPGQTSRSATKTVCETGKFVKRIALSICSKQVTVIHCASQLQIEAD